MVFTLLPMKIPEPFPGACGSIPVLSAPACALGEFLLPVDGSFLRQVELKASLSHVLGYFCCVVIEARPVIPVDLHPGRVRSLRTYLLFFKCLLYIPVLPESVINFHGKIVGKCD